MKPKVTFNQEEILGNVSEAVLWGTYYYYSYSYYYYFACADVLIRLLILSSSQENSSKCSSQEEKGGDLQREVFRISRVPPAWIWIVEEDGSVPAM